MGKSKDTHIKSKQQSIFSIDRRIFNETTAYQLEMDRSDRNCKLNPMGDFKLMQTLKERKPLFIKILAVVLLVLLCYILPQAMLFSTLCKRQDRNIPPNTEVIVSACKHPVVRGVPGGEVLFVHERLTDKMYLLDLRTGEKRKIPNYPLLHNDDRVVFLSSDLVWLRGLNPGDTSYTPGYILDLTDGQYYELLDLTRFCCENNKFNPANYSYIQSADRVFIDRSSNRLIALSTDFRTKQSERVILNGIISDDDEFLLKLIKTLEIDYDNVDSSRSGPPSNLPSPTGVFFVRNNGIYLSKANTVFDVIPYSYYFRSWYYDESGVVIHDNYGTYWIRTQFFGSYYHLSRPVLKLRLPIP